MQVKVWEMGAILDSIFLDMSRDLGPGLNGVGMDGVAWGYYDSATMLSNHRGWGKRPRRSSLCDFQSAQTLETIRNP